MNFDFTDDQQAIKSTAHDFLGARLKPEKLRELAESGTYDDALWKEMSDLGWPGIFVGEEHGGQGLGVVELVILMEELGYALAPSPFFSNAAAGLMIQHAGSSDQRDRWLPGIASGEQRGTVAYVENGMASLVADADSADVIVLFDSDADTASVVAASDAKVESVDTIDSTRRFSRVTPGNGGGEELTGGRGPADEAIAPIAVAIAGGGVGGSPKGVGGGGGEAQGPPQVGGAEGGKQGGAAPWGAERLQTAGGGPGALLPAP